jgi:hypothetical protein
LGGEWRWNIKSSFSRPVTHRPPRFGISKRHFPISSSAHQLILDRPEIPIQRVETVFVDKKAFLILTVYGGL